MVQILLLFGEDPVKMVSLKLEHTIPTLYTKHFVNHEDEELKLLN